MLKILLSDFSDVLLFKKIRTSGSLNELHQQLSGNDGYHFFDHFEINQELLELYQHWKKTSHLQVVMFTSGTIQEAPELTPILEPVFDQIYSSGKLGLSKSDPEAFEWVADKLQVSTNEIIFIDDQERNIAAAKESGVAAIQYTSNDLTKEAVEKLLTASQTHQSKG